MPRFKITLAEPRLYTVRDAAAFFSMSTSWVRERIKAGDLQGFLCGNMLVSGQSMNKFLASRCVSRLAVMPAEDEPAPAPDVNATSSAA